MSRFVASLVLPVVLVATVACGGDGSGSADDGGSAEEPVPAPTDQVPDESSDDESSDDESIDGAWVLSRGSLDGEPIELVEGWDVTLNIDGDRIGGTAACNGYGGTVAVGEEFELGGSFVVGELSWTEMGCEPQVMGLEQQYLAALDQIDSYELADTLSLARAGVGTGLMFERVETVDDTDLVGTTWVLDTLITGDAASNSPGMAGAFLEFSDDGTLIGSTGCRRLEGEWSLHGATIEIPVLAAIDDPAAGACAPESNDLDDAIIAVVESGSSVAIDGDRLTLTAPGGDGLSFRAGTVDGAGVDAGPVSTPVSTVVEDQLDAAGGVTGRVVYGAHRTEEGGEEALIEGTLAFGDDGCVRVDDVVLLWPFGTRWQARPPAVRVDGLTLVDADRIGAGGGFHDVEALGWWTDSDEAIEYLRACQPSPGDGVFVIQHPVERLE